MGLLTDAELSPLSRTSCQRGVFQDHNYGGPAISAPGPGSGPGQPRFGPRVRFPAGYRRLREGTAGLQMGLSPFTSSGSDLDGEPPEAFPVIGNLDKYISQYSHVQTRLLSTEIHSDTLHIGASNYV